MNKPLLHEKDFKLEEYEGFYEHHFFKPLDDDDAVNAHRVLPRVAWALDVAEEIQPKRILDLGCLDGYAALTITNNVDSVELAVGVDLSEDGITLAKQRAQKLKTFTVFQRGTIEDFLEACNDQFDLIMLFEVIEHVKDPKQVLKLIDKVLAPDGTVLISTPAFESPTFGKDDEQNKCHIRLYTMKDEDYEEENKYGHVRKATSITKEIGKDRIKDMQIYSELINVRFN